MKKMIYEPPKLIAFESWFADVQGESCIAGQGEDDLEHDGCKETGVTDNCPRD